MVYDIHFTRVRRKLSSCKNNLNFWEAPTNGRDEEKINTVMIFGMTLVILRGTPQCSVPV